MGVVARLFLNKPKFINQKKTTSNLTLGKSNVLSNERRTKKKKERKRTNSH
jgi:hypothetical protein